MVKCMFVDDWDCPVKRNEFPLEICKICVKARSIHEGTTKVKVPENGSDGKDKKKKDRLDIVSMLEESDEKMSGKEEEPLSKEQLNKKFHEGDLSVDEYIEKRKNAPRSS